MMMMMMITSIATMTPMTMNIVRHQQQRLPHQHALVDPRGQAANARKRPTAQVAVKTYIVHKFTVVVLRFK